MVGGWGTGHGDGEGDPLLVFVALLPCTAKASTAKQARRSEASTAHSQHSTAKQRKHGGGDKKGRRHRLVSVPGAVVWTAPTHAAWFYEVARTNALRADVWVQPSNHS